MFAHVSIEIIGVVATIAEHRRYNDMSTTLPVDDIRNAEGGPVAKAEPGEETVFLFTLLIFDWNDKVRNVRAIRAAHIAEAKTTAENVMLTFPRHAGYQLWRGGHQVAATFPTNETGVAAPRVAHN